MSSRLRSDECRRRFRSREDLRPDGFAVLIGRRYGVRNHRQRFGAFAGAGRRDDGQAMRWRVASSRPVEQSLETVVNCMFRDIGGHCRQDSEEL